MLHDLVIPSDAELRRQSLLERQLPLFELPSSEELRKYEQQKMNLASLSAVANVSCAPASRRNSSLSGLLLLMELAKSFLEVFVAFPFQFPPCKLEMNGMTRDHHSRTYVCDGVREEWLPLEDIFKDLPSCKPGEHCSDSYAVKELESPKWRLLREWKFIDKRASVWIFYLFPAERNFRFSLVLSKV